MGAGPAPDYQVLVFFFCRSCEPSSSEPSADPWRRLRPREDPTEWTPDGARKSGLPFPQLSVSGYRLLPGKKGLPGKAVFLAQTILEGRSS